MAFDTTPNPDDTEQQLLRKIAASDQAIAAALGAGAAPSTPSPALPYSADYVSINYTGTFVTSLVYKTGGSGGTTVKTLTLANDGTNYTSITAS